MWVALSWISKLTKIPKKFIHSNFYIYIYVLNIANHVLQNIKYAIWIQKKKTIERYDLVLFMFYSTLNNITLEQLLLVPCFSINAKKNTLNILLFSIFLKKKLQKYTEILIFALKIQK